MPGIIRAISSQSLAGACLLILICFPLASAAAEHKQIQAGVQSESSLSTKLTPQDLWKFGRISGLQVSPVDNRFLFLVREYDLDKNRGTQYIHAADSAEGPARRISPRQGRDSHARFRPDGRKIGFIHDGQLWEMDPDGTSRRRISDIPEGITSFAYSPDQQKILFTSPVPADQPGKKLFKGLDRAEAVLADELMYRHWDEWISSFSRIFTADYSDQGLGRPRDIMSGPGLESPPRPFGDTSQIAWSPDSRYIAYAARRTSGREYALGTDSRIMLYDLETGRTTRLDTSPGYDASPAFSPDGRSLAWLSMATPGYEADKNRILVMDLKSGETVDLTRDFEWSAVEFAWSRDREHIYFTALIRGSQVLHRLNRASGRIENITGQGWIYSSPVPAGDRVLALRSNMSSPRQVVALDPDTGRAEPVSRVNADLLSRFRMGEVRKMQVKTVDDQEMTVFMVLPPGFDPDRKYPAVLYCQGGPEQNTGPYWSYRWNFQTLAAAGYVLVVPARRGVPGFGRQWREGVLQDWGGLPMQDLLMAIDEAAQLPWVDEDRLAAVGPSYGGFSIYWLAGHHQGRFKALVAHDGIFHLQSMYAATDETFFMNHELGGPFWDKDQASIQQAYADSPHNFVQNWDTPLLVIHGGRDYRVPESQGLAAFNAARLRGIPARLLYFPEENHLVLSPQNSVLWYRTVLDWLDRWTGADKD
ncbi:MAG: prolyl oligopeptidase family serine peptidase [Desulfonatronovibrionaceae bacterium]